MSPHDLWHVAGFVVLAMLFAWAIVERRKTRRAIESHGGDGTDRATLRQRAVYLREPAAGAQGASAPPAPADEPATVEPGLVKPAPVEPTAPPMFPPPEPRSDLSAGAPEPASAQAPELRRSGPPTSAPELRGRRAARPAPPSEPATQREPTGQRADRANLWSEGDASDEALAERAPEPSRAAPPRPPSQQAPPSDAHVAVTPAVFGPVLPGLVAAGLGKRPSGTHSAAPVPRSDRRPLPPPPPPRPARTHTLVGLSDVASPPPLAPASRSPPLAPVPPPPRLAPAVEPAPGLPRVASADDYDPTDATVVGERLTAEHIAQLGLPVLDVSGRVVGRVHTKRSRP